MHERMYERTKRVPGQSAAEETRRAGAVGAVIVAAGPSTRMGGVDKIWTPVAGEPLLVWTIRAFEAAKEVAEIVVVVAPERLAEAQALVRQSQWGKVRAVVAGGRRRCDSVREGVKALSPGWEWVVIHDGARPLVTPAMIAAGLEAAQKSEGAAAAYEPAKETIKQVRDDAVVETPPRADLALLQTPQVFCRGLLAHLEAACSPGDDPQNEAVSLLRQGVRVAVFASGHENVKVTTPDDLEIVEALLRQ